MRRIAFFDVDKTILDANSATLWLRREMRLGFVSKRVAFRGLFWIGLYTLGLARIDKVLVDAVKTLRDVVEKDVADRTAAFFHEEIRALIRPRALAAIEKHRAAGDAIYLLTTSSTYLSKLLAEELKIDGYGCNELEVADGLFTGNVTGPLCFGVGKVTRAKVIAKSHDVSLEDCTFYSDSYSDLPMLLAVGTPVVVTPDQRLRRFAKQRGWPVEDWSVTLGRR